MNIVFLSILIYNWGMKEIIVNKENNSNKISKVILSSYPYLSRNLLQKLFRKKDIKVNGNRIKDDIPVYFKDKIEIYCSDNLLLGLPTNIKYYYEDDNILVAYKPSKIECHNDKTNSTFEYAVKLDRKDTNLKVCHRLDTNTEGLVIFSKNEISHKEVLHAFKNSLIHKTYLTFVYGKVPKNHDILENYILKDNKYGYSKIVEKALPTAKPAITEYTLIEYIPNINVSILNVTLHTGRTHQIRAHMKYLYTPIIGDSKYSTNKINKLFGYKNQLLYAIKYSFDFDNASPLSYLNNISIYLNQDEIISKFKERQNI